MIPALYLAGALLLGAIPFALLLGRLRGIDIRKVGSGNVGATNLARSAGLGWGIVAFLLDAAKGFAPVWFASEVVPEPGPWFAAASGAAAVLGHCFSPFLRFRGGKGVATAVGALAAIHPPVTVTLLLVWLVVLALFRNVGVASSAAALTGCALGGYFLTGGQQQVLGTILLLLGVVILVRHRSNLGAFLRRSRGEAVR